MGLPTQKVGFDLACQVSLFTVLLKASCCVFPDLAASSRVPGARAAAKRWQEQVSPGGLRQAGVLVQPHVDLTAIGLGSLEIIYLVEIKVLFPVNPKTVKLFAGGQQQPSA